MSKYTRQPYPSPVFPDSWRRIFDKAIPAWVKAHLAPDKRWKGDFEQRDAKFFASAVTELSDLLTNDRSGGVINYFNHPRLRAAYYLYFLPLQAAKFLTLFQAHPPGLERALAKARENKRPFRVVDLGAGPGTASMALLAHLSAYERESLPEFEFLWLDLNKTVMEEGKTLFREVITPETGTVSRIRFETAAWWDLKKHLKHDPDLILSGNVLNEWAPGRSRVKSPVPTFRDLASRTGAGGLLLVEPALRRPSQWISTIRDAWIASAAENKEPHSVVGPCLHLGPCPLVSGRDWCHMSVRADIPGDQFRFFSRALGSTRNWLKFSYCWLSPEAPEERSAAFRVVSNRLPDGRAQICMPERCEKQHVGEGTGRGDLLFPV